MKEDVIVPSSSQIQPSDDPEMKPVSNLKLILIAVSILILIITAITLGYLLVRRQAAINPSDISQTVKTPPISSAPKDTDAQFFQIPQRAEMPSSWKTYSSDNIGFSVSYPSEWSIETVHTPTLTRACNYEAGDHCPHLLISRSYSVGDTLEEQFSFDQNSTLPQKPITKFETSIDGQQAIGYAWMEYNNYCGDGKEEGECPLLIIDYKFYPKNTTSDQLYHIRYYEQVKDQTAISTVTDLQFFDEIKQILASFQLIDSTQAQQLNEEGTKNYTDASTGLTFDIPANTQLVENDPSITSNSKSLLYITIEQIPKEDADSLSCSTGSMCSQYAKGSVTITENITLQQYEVCNVSLVRSADFYKDGRKFKITLSASNLAEQVMSEMPDYFGIDEENCGTMNVWNNQKGFIDTLKTGKGRGVAQRWFDDFDQVINSITWE